MLTIWGESNRPYRVRNYRIELINVLFMLIDLHIAWPISLEYMFEDNIYLVVCIDATRHLLSNIIFLAYSKVGINNPCYKMSVSPLSWLDGGALINVEAPGCGTSVVRGPTGHK